MVEAWTSLNLPARTKASLSSKWSDIKSRTILLDPASEQNRAVKSPKKKKKSPAADTSAPVPVDQ